MPKWLSDSTGFFVGDEPIAGQSRWLGTMTLDGRFTQLVQIGPELGWVTAISRDARTAFVFSRRGASADGAYTGIVAVDLTTGQQRRVFEVSEERINSAELSPDGRTLALFLHPADPTRPKALATLAIDGSGYRQVYETTRVVANIPQQIQWWRDGRALLFLEDNRIMRIPVEGGVPEFTGLAMVSQGGHGFSLHPDGSRMHLGIARKRPRNPSYGSSIMSSRY